MIQTVKKVPYLSRAGIEFEELDMVEVWIGSQRELFRLRVSVVEINSVLAMDVSVLVRQTPGIKWFTLAINPFNLEGTACWP